MKLVNLQLTKMFSGNLQIEISDKIAYDEFDNFGSEIVKILSANILSKSEGVDFKIWEIEIDNTHFRLVYDDFPQMVTMEAKDSSSSDLLKTIIDKKLLENISI